MNGAPAYDVDFYDDAFIADPLPHYAAMRALGPVVYLPRHDNYAMVGFDALREAMRRPDLFRSGVGVAGDEAGCAFLRGNTLASDAPLHDTLRDAMGAPLLPGALEEHRPWIARAAEALVDTLCERGRFDAMEDAARHLPLTVVTELVGLPDDGRERMLDWAAASFDILGVQNERGRAGIETIKDMRQWIATRATAERLRPGSWTARIMAMSARGEIAADHAPLLVRDYINPSLDTTISATGELIFQLGRRPDQWDLIRRDPTLVPRAVEEAVRLATPIRSFTRTLTENYRLAGVDLPAGARAMMVFASANRDGAHFADPDAFDVRRRERDHVGFGHGIHMCVGMHLARLEMTALLTAMVARIERFHVGTPTVVLNNTIRSYARLPVSIDLAPARRPVKPTEPPVAGDAGGWIDARVASRAMLAETVVGLTLISADGAALPDHEAGSHIDVEISPGLVRQYSLCAAPSAERSYRIAVHREPVSRGGSSAIHAAFPAGRAVRISSPRNAFRIDPQARRHLLMAGGIGITPLYAMAWRLHEADSDFHLVYCARDRRHAALADELLGAPFADRVRLVLDDDPARGDPFADLAGCPHGRAVYCCGPAGFVDAVRSRARDTGFAAEQVHVELFKGTPIAGGAPFTVHARRAGVRVAVAADATMLGALAEAGVIVPSSCLSGVCGTCLVDVVAGTPDHRDQVQTAAEKAGNRRVALCCSRALTAELVIDL